MTVFDELNDNQIKAVKHIYGPCYVNAGPGAGKTRVLVRKVAYAIMNGVKPESIIIFTFTNKAAHEIRTRVSDYVGKALASKMKIGTYHSICCRLLREFQGKSGLMPHFTILDEKESLTIITECAKAVSIQLMPKAVSYYISECKRNLMTYEEAVRTAKGADEKKAMVYRNYQLQLERQNSVDFDDLILKTIQMIENNESVQEAIHRRYQMVVCDEGHDSAEADLRLIYLLLNEAQNLTLILDVDQSIYGFRGANIESVVAFKEKLNNPAFINLDQNYRSSETIVNASASLIGHNPVLIPKVLHTDNPIGEQIIFHEALTEKMENIRIKYYIDFLHDNYKLPYKDIAVLYRTKSQAEQLAEYFTIKHIPHEVVGSPHLFTRKEIKDILSYFKIVFNQFDLLAFKRSVAIPKRGIGKETLKKITDYAENYNCSLVEACATCDVMPKARKVLNEYLETLSILVDMYWNAPPCEAIDYILNTINYYNIIKKDKDFEKKKELIEQFVSLSEDYATIEEMLEESSLYTQEDLSNRADAVKLMTLHASKGLEFEAVIICGCNELNMPHIKAVTPKQIEEERRLFYVGITRAMKYLFLTRAKVVCINDHMRTTKCSRFIKEIAEHYLFYH